MRAMNAEQLVKDLVNHKMTVLVGNGVHRHICFRQPNNSNLWFEIITWPGSLTINGDMGTWSFSRLDDMFDFFRSDQLKINADYWAEKITSESRFGGPSQRFSPETFKASVFSRLDDYDLPDTEKAEIKLALDGEVFGDEDEATIRRALEEFEHGEFTFLDTWEIDGRGYTYHYLWCLYAIVWAIQQYDTATAGHELAKVSA